MNSHNSQLRLLPKNNRETQPPYNYMGEPQMQFAPTILKADRNAFHSAPRPPLSIWPFHIGADRDPPVACRITRNRTKQYPFKQQQHQLIEIESL